MHTIEHRIGPARLQTDQILVLDISIPWVASMRGWVNPADRAHLEIPEGLTMNDLDRLSEERWRLVFMSSVGAVTDQRLPLDALYRWMRNPKASPVAILSPMETPKEASDALVAGAIWYARKPQRKEEFDVVFSASLAQAQKYSSQT